MTDMPVFYNIANHDWNTFEIQARINNTYKVKNNLYRSTITLQEKR